MAFNENSLMMRASDLLMRRDAVVQGSVCVAELRDMIKGARLSKGWRQSDVAARSSGRLEQTYISQVELGKNRQPSFEKLEAFAEVLQLNLNDLKIAAGYPVVTVYPHPSTAIHTSQHRRQFPRLHAETHHTSCYQP